MFSIRSRVCFKHARLKYLSTTNYSCGCCFTKMTLPKNGGVEHCPYDGHPLVQSMLRYQNKRTKSLEDEGKIQINYPLSSDGWLSTIFIVRGRALDWMIWPWTVVVAHAVVYTIVEEIYFGPGKRDMKPWEVFFRCALCADFRFYLCHMTRIHTLCIACCKRQFCSKLNAFIPASFSTESSCKSLLDGERVLGQNSSANA
jgi:hypothetical protein